jgi:hypothetical protein
MLGYVYIDKARAVVAEPDSVADRRALLCGHVRVVPGAAAPGCRDVSGLTDANDLVSRLTSCLCLRVAVRIRASAVDAVSKLGFRS